ncbi:MAG: hypothetical protein A3J51_06035 [Omnitrophica WOR_2 bacterium RIFCSPHIGHO2_02_FULL_45_21]|nr:MAG: hypothetical protein A3J51_06035 [Omnitrophica WOR_2 bacterium RIFCSPHIGHO2_02_FULL_45_21]
MKKTIFCLILITVISFLALPPGYAYWIWTPKTGRWTSPKYSVKPNPKEQLKFSLEFYEQGKYKETIDECRKLIKRYPRAYEAAEGQFYIGSSLEKLNKPYEAYQAYQKVIDKYLFSTRIDEIIECQLKIGEAFMSGEKRKALGMELPVENPSLEIFRKVVENSTYGKFAAKAQYLLAMTLKNLGRFQEARDEFEKVVTTYPDSEWVAAAKFQAADSLGRIAPKADYDQELTKEAKEKFQQFLGSHPDTSLSRQAEHQIDSLKEKEAEGNLKIAEFYEKQKKYEPARIYYQEIVESCYYCSSAKKAREKLKELEKK